MKNFRSLLIVLAVFSAIIGGILLSNQMVVLTGEKIKIEVIPIDPSDLFRGRYVALNYDLSRLDDEFINEADLDRLKGFGETVYVTLDLDEEGFATAKMAYADKPESGLFLKGKVKFFSEPYQDWNRATRVPPPRPVDGESLPFEEDIPSPERVMKPGYIQIEYGIESFFLNPEDAKEAERGLWETEGKTYVEVSLSKDGKAVLTKLVVGETEYSSF